MKIRNGFVSNSSSSSFIVAFDKLPESPLELQEMLFGAEMAYPNPYPSNHSPWSWPASVVTETVWNDLQRATPLSDEEVVDEFMSGYIPQANYPEYPYNSGMEDWDTVCKKRDAINKGFAEKFLEKVDGKTLIVFSYGDNDGEYYCALEHGPLFSNIEHFRISHH